MPASLAPFPLLTRLHLALYALVFAAVAGFAYTDENPTALILISPALFLAWFLIDAPPQTPKPDPDSRQLPRLNLFPAAAELLVKRQLIDGAEQLQRSQRLFLV